MPKNQITRQNATIGTRKSPRLAAKKRLLNFPYVTVEEITPTALHGDDGKTHVYMHKDHVPALEWLMNPKVVMHLYDDDGTPIN